MVCHYTSVQREMEAHEALSKTTRITETAGKQHVRQALDHFEFSQGDRNYHFLTQALWRKSSHQPRPGTGLPDAVCFRIYSRRPSHSRRSNASVTTLRYLIHPWLLVFKHGTFSFELKSQQSSKTKEDEVKHPSSRKVTELATRFESSDAEVRGCPMIGGKSRTRSM